jgi:hypothetical protein
MDLSPDARSKVARTVMDSAFSCPGSGGPGWGQHSGLRLVHSDGLERPMTKSALAPRCFQAIFLVLAFDCLAPGLVEKIAERCGRVPRRVLVDSTAMTREDIVKLAERYPAMMVYSPPPGSAPTSPPRRCASGAGNAAASRQRSKRGEREWRARTAKKSTVDAS